jgi:hypothetical protein
MASAQDLFAIGKPCAAATGALPVASAFAPARPDVALPGSR